MSCYNYLLTETWTRDSPLGHLAAVLWEHMTCWLTWGIARTPDLSYKYLCSFSCIHAGIKQCICSYELRVYIIYCYVGYYNVCRNKTDICRPQGLSSSPRLDHTSPGKPEVCWRSQGFAREARGLPGKPGLWCNCAVW